VSLKLYLFVSPGCIHCPKAEKIVRKIAPEYYDKGLVYKKIRTKTPEGKQLSLKYNVMGTPTMIFLDSSMNELKRIVGVPGEGSFRSSVEKLLGLRKSFFERLFGRKESNEQANNG